MARRARRNLLRWCKFVDPTYETPPHIQTLANALEAVERKELRRLMVFMPPRHGKSLLTTRRFPAWYMGKNQDKEVVIAAHTASLAESFSRTVRNEMRDFGEEAFFVKVADDSSSVQKWNLEKRKGGLVAAGIGGPITGRGADLMVIDDPVKDREMAFSEVQRESQKEWYRTVARTRLHPGGAIVLVMTRWHEDDLAGWLLEEAKKGGEQWQVINMPMTDDAGGSILWPGRYSEFEVASIRAAVGSYAWEALYQQRPSSPTGNIFKRDWWRWWSTKGGEGVDLVVTPDKLEWMCMSWDLAFKDTKKSDFVAGHVWGGRGADRVMLDRVHGRMNFTATVNAIRALAAKWPKARAKYVEDKANGPAVIQVLEKEIPGLIAVNPEGGKVARAYAVSPEIESGNVYLPYGAPWASDFIQECAGFPNAKNDDDVDAMTQALIRMSLDRQALVRARKLATL